MKNALGATLAAAIKSKIKDQALRTHLEYLTLEELQDVDITTNY